jgi:hypothetical protein
MSIPTIPPYVPSFKPVPTVTPFTYRDGVTMLKKLDNMVRYINIVIIPFINNNFEALADEVEADINNMIQLVNDAIQEVIDSGVTIQDPVVAGIFGNPASQTRVVTDALYAAKSALQVIEDLVNTGRLSDAALAAEFAAKSIETIVTTGRLSDAALNTEFVARADNYDKLAAIGLIKVITPEMYGAVGDGTADDTTAFQTMATHVATGVKVVLNGNKTYVLNDTFHVTNANDWEMTGGDIKFKTTASSVSGALKAILLENCNNVRISNMTIEQTNQGGPQYTGISIQTSKDVVLEKVHAHNFRWIGLEASNTSTHITFDKCVATQCRFGAFSNIVNFTLIGGRYSSEWSATAEFIAKAGVWDTTSLYYDGIIIGGSDWTITDAVFNDNGQSGIYAQSTFRGVISGNNVNGNWNKGIDLGTQIAGDNIYHIIMSGNTLTGNKTGNISLKGANACSVIGNMINTPNDTFGIGLGVAADSNSVIGNVILSQSTTSAAIFAESTGSDPANGNIIASNIMGAAVPYSVDTTQNVVIKNSNGVYTIDSTLTIDRSDSSGFSGRALMTLLTSSDNANGQIIVNKPISFTDSGGVGVRLITGGITSSSTITPQTGATGARPSASTAGAGAMYYDTTLGKPIWSTGAAWKDAAGTTV